jgi:hypothetical protein
MQASLESLDDKSSYIFPGMRLYVLLQNKCMNDSDRPRDAFMSLNLGVFEHGAQEQVVDRALHGMTSSSHMCVV